MTEPAPRALRQRRKRKRAGILRWAMAAALVLLIAALGLVLLVVAGPTEFGLIRDRIAGIIRNSLGPGYEVSIDRAMLDVDPVLGFIVRVDNIAVRDSGQTVVAKVPTTRFAVNPYSLLMLKAEVKQVEMVDPEISFVRGESGVYIGNASTVRPDSEARITGASTLVPPGEISDGGFPEVLGALYVLDRGIEPQIDRAIGAGFQRFGMVDGVINVFDVQSGTQRRFPGTDINVTVDPATAAVQGSFATSGFGGQWTANIERTRDVHSGSHVMSAVFSQLMIADIFPKLGDGDGLLAADIPLYGRAMVRMSADGSVEEANARLDVGAGIVRFGEERETVLLDEATIKLRWDVANRQLVMDPSTFFFGETRGVVAGRVFPQGEEGQRQYGFEFESPGAVLAPRDSGEPPMIAQRIHVSGVADLDARVVNFDSASITTAEAAVAAAGTIGFEGPTPSLAMAATFTPMTVASLKQMWVPLIAPGARKWVMQHVKGGRIAAGRYEAAIPAGVLWTGKRPVLPDGSMRLDMRLEGVTFTTFGEMPPITNAFGNLTATGSTLGVDMERGEVQTPHGNVAINNGVFAIPNTSKRPSDGLIEVQVSGPAAALGAVADANPIRALVRRELAATDLSGSADANISVRLPLRDGLTDADVDWKVVVNTDNVASKTDVEGHSVSAANVALTVTPNDVTIYGKAKIDGTNADVSMTFPLTGGAGSDRRVRLLLDDAARKRFGIGLENVISGTIGALVADTPDGKGQRYDLDLRRARVVLPGMGWTKGIGVPATLTFDLKPSQGGYAVSNLDLKGDGFGFAGSAVLDDTYNVVSADITRLSLRAGDAVALKLARSRSGYALTVRGSAFDMRGMMGQVRDRNDQAGGFPDIALEAQVDRLIGFNQEEVRNAALSLVSVGGTTQKISFAGKLGNSDVALNYSVAPGGTTLQAHATDGGRLLRFTDLYARMAGGVVRIGGEAGRNGPMIGTIEVENFDIVNEPTMERVAVNTNQAGNSSFNPRRVNFDRMVARFRKSERAVTIEDALLAGATVGATFTGRYDLPNAHVNLAGTYLPAYAFNNLFSRVPILGFALGGGMREGLIGVTFKVDGPISQPQVFVNPLSAVAPGIFRKIFEFQRPPQQH